MHNMRQLTKDEQANIYGGSMSVFLSLAPMVISGVSAISNIIKMFMSTSGEIKTKDSSLKWNDASKKESQIKSIYLAY
ncbi:hypothetical protein [Mycoplasmopsis lipofaciens]|uniref:hypothetical protein n=1 Tax=Mycoplasmopsis lipofaciens TaxID=114884 RepID=UPI0004804574|nr:hypothetical protein [Mycoplasmopsis lipofaciens]